MYRTIYLCRGDIHQKVCWVNCQQSWGYHCYGTMLAHVSWTTPHQVVQDSLFDCVSCIRSCLFNLVPMLMPVLYPIPQLTPNFMLTPIPESIVIFALKLPPIIKAKSCAPVPYPNQQAQNPQNWALLKSALGVVAFFGGSGGSVMDSLLVVRARRTLLFTISCMSTWISTVFCAAKNPFRYLRDYKPQCAQCIMWEEDRIYTSVQDLVVDNDPIKGQHS